MNAVRHSSIRRRFFLALFVLFVLPASLLAARPEVVVSVDGASATFAADAALYVRIGGPDGYIRELRGEGHLQWTPAYGLADGIYRYDCYASVSVDRDAALGEAEREAAAKGASSRIHGVILIENGALTEKETGPTGADAEPVPLGMGGSTSKAGYGHLFAKVVGGVLNALVPPAFALDTIDDDLRVKGYLRVKLDPPAYKKLEYDPSVGDLFIDGGDLIVESSSPSVYFQDTTTGDDNWRVKANDSSFTIVDTVGTNNNFPLQIDTQAGTNVHNSIFVNSLGDVSFADQTVYIDKWENAIGIGTSTPAGSIHIIDSAWPELVLQDTGSGARIWELEATSDEIRIRGEHPTSGAASYPFTVYNDADDDALVIGKPTSSSRNVGIGTFDPDTGLHIWRGDGNAVVKVEENMGITAQRFQVQLENNGGTGFLFTDTSVANREWQNAMLSNGDFAFSFIGTGGAELQMKPSGEVRMGPGPTINFQLKTNGDLSIPNGKVVATAFQQSSSRSVKQAFAPVDEGEVLDKLLALEISEWEYRDPSVGGRHLGPMAEEFHAAFGFGTSDKHIYPADMAGIGLVAARQLRREAQDRDVKIYRQNTEIEAQNKRIEMLETHDGVMREQSRRIAALEEQNDHLKMANAELTERLARLEKWARGALSGPTLE